MAVYSFAEIGRFSGPTNDRPMILRYYNHKKTAFS